MDQKMAKNISEKKLTPRLKTLMFEIVRAKNAVLSRTIGEGTTWGIYTIYSGNKEYVQQVIDMLHKDKFGAILILEDKNFSVIKIVWQSEYVELPSDI